MASRERGGCLTAWLILVLIANALIAFYYLTSTSALQQVYPVSSVVFLLLAVIGAVNVVSAIALWTWHKWGFYLFAITSVITLVINIGIGLPIVSSLSGLIGVGILWYLLSKKWSAFE